MARTIMLQVILDYFDHSKVGRLQLESVSHPVDVSNLGTTLNRR